MLPPGSSTSSLVALTQFQLLDVPQTGDLLQPVLYKDLELALVCSMSTLWTSNHFQPLI